MTSAKNIAGSSAFLLPAKVGGELYVIINCTNVFSWDGAREDI